MTGFRDPCLWREGNDWMLILGSGTQARGGAILLYTSTDLRHWTYLHPLVEGSPSKKDTTNPVDTGDMWECPDFFPLGKKHVLLISTMGKVRWKVGTYANQRFTPEKEGVVDWGSYYAAKTMLDRDGNRILWGWIPEARPDADLIAAGWAGAMSLPRVMSLNDENELQTEPLATVNVLRGQHAGFRDLPKSLNIQELSDKIQIHNLAAEIDLQFQCTSDVCTFWLRSESGDFATISVINRTGQRELRVNEVAAPLAGNVGSPVQLHMFLDGSILEIFANKTTALTARIYRVPTSPIRLKFEGSVEMKSLDVWQMQSISKDRLTGSLCL